MTRPFDQFFTGSRSHSTHMRQVSIRSSSRSTSGRWPLKCCHSSLGSASRIPAFLVAVGVEHGDEVIELAAAQRIMHEMGARPGPEHHVGPPEIVRHLGALEHRAIGDMAADARRAVADDLLPHLRPHAVAADQRAALHAFAAVQALTVTPSPSSSKSSTRRLVSSEIRLLFWQAFRKTRMDVGAVGHRIGLLEARDEFLLQAACG